MMVVDEICFLVVQASVEIATLVSNLHDALVEAVDARSYPSYPLERWN